MAIYHASTKPIARSSGRSAVAAAAYRAGQELVDERTGLVHDYTRKGGVVSAQAVLADGSTVDRSALWNAAEFAEKRKDGRTAREWIVALPAELDAQGRSDLAREFGVELAKRYGVGVDIAVHMPDREGDNRNHHAHILTTTREVSRGEDGQLVLGAKTIIELSDTDRRKMGLGAAAEEVKIIRGLWEELANGALERAGRSERIDGRSLEAQGIDREPTTHLGQMATDMERRGIATDRGAGNRQAAANNAERDQVRGELIDLQAERAKRELVRLKAMTARELRAEMERIRPEPFEAAVERHPKMQAARQVKEGVGAELAQAKTIANLRGIEIEEWRRTHPIKARLHDTGLFRSKDVTSWQAQQKQAAERAEVLTRADQAAGIVLERLQPEIERQVSRQQAPVLAKVGEIQKLLAERVAQETQVQRQQKEISETLDTLTKVAAQRRMGAFEYRDQGSRWRGLDDATRQLVDGYNRMSEPARAQVIEAFRERMTTDPDALRTMQKALAAEKDRHRDRGMER